MRAYSYCEAPPNLLIPLPNCWVKLGEFAGCFISALGKKFRSRWKRPMWVTEIGGQCTFQVSVVLSGFQQYIPDLLVLSLHCSKYRNVCRRVGGIDWILSELSWVLMCLSCIFAYFCLFLPEAKARSHIVTESTPGDQVPFWKYRIAAMLSNIVRSNPWLLLRRKWQAVLLFPLKIPLKIPTTLHDSTCYHVTLGPYVSRDRYYFNATTC
jgi:hypothetical protein